MKNKLILIEGLPSSGKTTTTKMTHKVLNNLDINNKVFYEGDLDHPADYDGVSFFSEVEFYDLLSKYKKERKLIEKIAIKRQEGYYIEYKKRIKSYNDKFSDDLINSFLKHDVYELTLDRHIDILLKSWERFRYNALNEENVYIFDCAFIQNPVTVTMIRDNAEKKVITEYIKELENIIKPLNPILIYLDQDDIRYSFKKVIKERPNKWLEFFIDYTLNQGYGKDNNLKGLDGIFKVLEERKKLEHELFDVLDIEKIIINNSEFNLKCEEIRSIIKKYI
ncbi:MAG: hypothetical protein FH751_02885 [Firmicutes bacterium]|nr:hypothetical protein [Bacillota bacterium]